MTQPSTVIFGQVVTERNVSLLSYRELDRIMILCCISSR
jgi:hypothetical protein